MCIKNCLQIYLNIVMISANYHDILHNYCISQLLLKLHDIDYIDKENSYHD